MTHSRYYDEMPDSTKPPIKIRFYLWLQRWWEDNHYEIERWIDGKIMCPYTPQCEKCIKCKRCMNHGRECRDESTD